MSAKCRRRLHQREAVSRRPKQPVSELLRLSQKHRFNKFVNTLAAGKALNEDLHFGASGALLTH